MGPGGCQGEGRGVLRGCGRCAGGAGAALVAGAAV